MSVAFKGFVILFMCYADTYGNLKENWRQSTIPRLQQAVEGCSIQLHCAVGLKSSHAHWDFQPCGMDVNQTLCSESEAERNKTWLPLPYNSTSIKLTNVTVQQSGLYRCREPATDHINVYTTVELQILGYGIGEDVAPPKIIDTALDNITVLSHSQLSLQCKVASRTKPTIIWLKEGSGPILYKGIQYEPIAPTGEISLSTNIHLSKTTLKEITTAMEGFYHCLAINTKGFSNHRTFVKVIPLEALHQQSLSSFYLFFLMPLGLALPAILLWFCYVKCRNGDLNAKDDKLSRVGVEMEILNESF